MKITKYLICGTQSKQCPLNFRKDGICENMYDIGIIQRTEPGIVIWICLDVKNEQISVLQLYVCLSYDKKYNQYVNLYVSIYVPVTYVIKRQYKLLHRLFETSYMYQGIHTYSYMYIHEVHKVTYCNISTI